MVTYGNLANHDGAWGLNDLDAHVFSATVPYRF